MASKKALLLIGTALAAGIGAPTFAQDRGRQTSTGSDEVNFNGMAAPKYSAATPLGSVDARDNLGNHIAEQPLDLKGFGVYNLEDIPDGSTRGDQAANKSYVDKVGEDSKDNLGNHIAVRTLNMDNFQIIALPFPDQPTAAANRAYVDSVGEASKDNLGDHTATEDLDMSDFQIINLDIPTRARDAANKIYVDDQIQANKDNLGNHIAQMNLSMTNFRITDVATPIDPLDAVNKLYLDTINTGVEEDLDELKNRRIIAGAGLLGGGDLSQDRTLSFDTAFGDGRYALRSRAITAGTGLSGGGDLSANRSLSFNTTWGDARYAQRSRLIATGSGLTGGGDLSANRTIGLDATVVRTTGDQTIGGAKTFTANVDLGGNIIWNLGAPTTATMATNKLYVDNSISDAIAAAAYSAGTGLTLTGSVFSFDTAWGDARYALRSRQIATGSGLTGGGNLAANRTIAVDGTVVRTSGNQNIAGNKTFIKSGFQSNLLLQRTDQPYNVTISYIASDGKAVFAGQGDNGWFAIGDEANLQYTAGGAFGVNVDTGNVRWKGVAYGIGSGLTGLNAGNLASGVVADARLPTDIVRSSRQIIAGSGLTGGGNLTANRTLALDGTVVRTSGDQAIAGNKTFSGSVAFSGERVLNVGTPTAATDGVNKSYVDTAIATAPDADTTYTAGAGLALTGTTFSFDTVWGDARYALSTRQILAGSGLTGGGNLAANRSFAVDGTVIRTTGNQTLAGVKTFTSTITGNVSGNAGTATRLQTPRQINGKPFDGSANIAIDYMASMGVLAPEENRAVNATGVYSYNANNEILGSGTPRTYWSILGFGRGTSGSAQLAANWNAGGEELWFRSLRDVQDPWYDWKEIIHSGNIASYVSANQTTYTAGTGLALTGTVFAFDTAWGDARYAAAARQITAGSGLTGGGNLTANRSFAVDASVVRTSGTQTIGGNKTLTSTLVLGPTADLIVQRNARIEGTLNLDGGKVINLATPTDGTDGANKAYVDAQIAAAPDADTTYTAGAGLSLAGTTFSFDTGWGDNRYALRARQILAGSGLTGGGDLSTNRTLSLDNTVVRTAGDQNIAGAKTFNGAVNFSAQRVLNVGTPTAGTDATNKDYVDTRIATAPDADTTYTAGAGLALTGTTFSFDTAWGDGRYALTARQIATGSGLTGGGNLTANRTIAVDGTVVRTSGNQTLSGIKTFTSTIAGSVSGNAGTATRLQTARLINGKAFDGAANIDIDYVRSRNYLVPETGRNAHSTGIYTYNYAGTIGAPAPSSYWSVMGFGLGQGGSAQLAANWVGGGQELYFRSLQDNTNDWFSWKEIVHEGNIASYVSANQTTYTAGTGLALTGNAFSFDTAWGDGRYALSSRQIIAGSGLTGGGNLTANRTIGLDATVVRTSGNQTIAGNKTFIKTGVQSNLVLQRTDQSFNTSISFIVGNGTTVVAGQGDAGWFSIGDNTNLQYVADGAFGVQAVTGNVRWKGVASGIGSGLTGLNAGNLASGVVADARLPTNIVRSTRQILTGSGLTGGGNLTANRTIGLDATVVRTTGNQTIAGAKTFTDAVSFSGDRILNVGTPTAATDGVNKGYVDAQILAAPDADTTYTAGTGLALTGTTFSFDTAWGDARYALSSRQILAGSGLTGGGNLTANRTISLDATVVRTTGVQTIGGSKTLTSTLTIGPAADLIVQRNQRIEGTLNLDGGKIINVATPTDATDAANKAYVDAQVASVSSASYTAGAGLSLTGSVFAFDTTWGDARYALTSRQITAGSGLTGGGNLTANRSFAVDATVIRTTGNQTLGGTKTFSSAVIVQTPTAANHATTKAYVDAQIAAAPDADTTYSAGTGLSLTGTSFAFNTTWGDARYALAARQITAGTGLSGGGNLTANRSIALAADQIRRGADATATGVMAYSGTSRVDGQLYGGSVNPTSATRLNYDGNLWATRFYSTVYYYFSDRNLKENIETIEAETGMDMVRKLRPVSYTWKESKRDAVGIIAQEVEEVLPTAVTTTEDGTMAVDYVQMIAPMLAAIQELDARVQQLEAAR